jgi:hypothetical protein
MFEMFQKNKRYRLMPPCHQEAAHVCLLQCSMTEPTGALRRLRRGLVESYLLFFFDFMKVRFRAEK